MTSRQYELVYILSPDATEQEVTDLHTQVEAIVARFQGEHERPRTGAAASWPTRSASTEGTYVLEVFNGTGELTKELDRRLKVIDQVIRHLVVRVDEEMRVAERVRRAARPRSTGASRAGLPAGGPRRSRDDDARR